MQLPPAVTVPLRDGDRRHPRCRPPSASVKPLGASLNASEPLVRLVRQRGITIAVHLALGVRSYGDWSRRGSRGWRRHTSALAISASPQDGIAPPTFSPAVRASEPLNVAECQRAAG